MLPDSVTILVVWTQIQCEPQNQALPLRAVDDLRTRQCFLHVSLQNISERAGVLVQSLSPHIALWALLHTLARLQV